MRRNRRNPLTQILLQGPTVALEYLCHKQADSQGALVQSREVALATSYALRVVLFFSPVLLSSLLEFVAMLTRMKLMHSSCPCFLGVPVYLRAPAQSFGLNAGKYPVP